ncbi:MAG: signal peptidase I [Gemmatimonadota bacterium]
MSSKKSARGGSKGSAKSAPDKQERRRGPRKAAGADQAAAKEGRRRWATEWVKTLLIAIPLFLLLRTFLFQTFVITSGSMERTLLVGDFLAISKAAYGTRIPGTSARTPGYSTPKRDHIIVFRRHNPELDVVKRVVGVPGDTMEMHGKELFRNGERMDEPYVRHSDPAGNPRDPEMDWQLPFLVPGSRPADFRPTRDEWGPVVVPEDHLMVMGDNRDDSIDSRYWGFLDQQELKGRVLFIYYSYDREALAPFPLVTEARWSRIFDGVR